MQNKIKELLFQTGRRGVAVLYEYMEENGFFQAPCSGAHHLAKEGGLAEHSLNVYRIMNADAASKLDPEEYDKMKNSIIICSLLHDIGKIGQFQKPLYVPNMLKGRVTKANPNPEPVQSDKKPFVTNPELLSVPHEIRSVSIIGEHMELTEDEYFAILYHNGLYGSLKYELQGKETPLYMLLHFADMWASRVTEMESGIQEEDE